MRIYLFVIIFFLIFSSLAQSAYAWLSGWQYRTAITINNTQNSNNLTDYQVNVTLNTQNLISNGKMQPYCNDTRFTDSDGDTLLNYWIESGCNTTSTKIWVKVPNISASSTKTIYMYYGNPSAASASNATTTMLGFENFDSVTCGSWSSCFIGTTYCKSCSNGWFAKAEQIWSTGTPNTNAVANQDSSDGNPSPSFNYTTDNSFFGDLWIYKNYIFGEAMNITVSFDRKAGGSYNPGYQHRWDVLNGSGVPCDKGRQIGNCGEGELNSSNTLYHEEHGNLASWTNKYKDNLTTISGNITIAIWTQDGWTAQNFWSKIDNVKIRKYTSPEPITSLGNEEAEVPPTLNFVWEYPLEPATYSPGATYRFNITVCDENGATDISKVLFEWNGEANISIIDYTVHNATCRNYTTTKTDLSTGTYNYKWFANDTANTWSNVVSNSYTINQNTTNPVDIYFINSTGIYKNQNITVILGEQITANVTAMYSNSGTAALYEDESSVSNPRTTTLSFGLHSYKGNITGNINYSSNSTGATYYIKVIDTTSPIYSLNSTNSTSAGSIVSHNLYWQDNVGLSYAIFSFDNCTGSLQNITGMSLSEASTWSNFTVTINSTIGCVIRWCVYANDTSGNWNSSCSNPFSYVTRGVNCEAGGPYHLGSTVLVVGNVFGEITNETNVTINITKSGSLKASQTTTSDSSGIYYSIFNQYLDVGEYVVNVVANSSTNEFFCSDEFEVVSVEARKECSQKTISIEGKAIDTFGNPINSGKAFISVEGISTTNSTNFSNGEFQAFLAACLYPEEKYLVQLTIIDDVGRKGIKNFYYLAT